MYSDIISFIRELYSEPTRFIPLHNPIFRGNEKKYLNECIDSTFVSSVGKFVDLFEQKVAQFTGTKNAVACVNGTNALQLALILVGVENDDEVITQPLTFIATANAISYCGAHPIFVDVNKETLGLCPVALAGFLQDNSEMKNGECFNKKTGRRIKACVPMHTFGHPCRIDDILSVCKTYNIELVEDAAESLGSLYRDQHTGTFGKIGVLSFNGNKVITCGGGGMLLINDDSLAKKAKHLSTQAKVPHRWEFVHDEVGYNYRMPNINAALGCAQLEHIDVLLKSKRTVADKYKTLFANIEGIDFIAEPEQSKSNFWLNAIVFMDKEARDNFLFLTNEQGIMTRPIWELMNNLPMYNNCQCGNLENAEWLVERVVNLPSSAR